jgi:hypothetical protein
MRVLPACSEPAPGRRQLRASLTGPSDGSVPHPTELCGASVLGPDGLLPASSPPLSFRYERGLCSTLLCSGACAPSGPVASGRTHPCSRCCSLTRTRPATTSLSESRSSGSPTLKCKCVWYARFREVPRSPWWPSHRHRRRDGKPEISSRIAQSFPGSCVKLMCWRSLGVFG